MSFQSLQEEALAMRELFNMLYINLPRVQAQEHWMDRHNRPTHAVMDRTIDLPVSSTTPEGRRVVVIPVKDLDPVVFYDKWAGRGDNSPLEYACPFGYDLVDAPFETIRRNLDSVRKEWGHIRNAGHIRVSDIIMPSVQRLLETTVGSFDPANA